MILIVKHIDIEGPGSMEKFFLKAGRAFSTTNLAKEDRLPGSLKDIEAVVVLGGPMNAYEEDRYPFLRTEDSFLKEVLKDKIPTLGICLGAQLLAKACNARVRKCLAAEIGWHKIELTDDGKADALFKGLPDRFVVFEWHEDTFDIPGQGLHLAGNKACANQAFKIGKNAYGFQFHIEVTPQIIDSWIAAYANEESRRFDAEEMLEQAYKTRGGFEKQANMIYSNFVRMIDGMAA